MKVDSVEVPVTACSPSSCPAAMTGNHTLAYVGYTLTAQRNISYCVQVLHGITQNYPYLPLSEFVLALNHKPWLVKKQKSDKQYPQIILHLKVMKWD